MFYSVHGEELVSILFGRLLSGGAVELATGVEPAC